MMKLRAASESNIAELMTWFADQTAVRSWGGPAFRYPFTKQSFVEDIRWQQMPTFAMVDARGEMAGFGQYYEKYRRGHLARLIVSARHRGQGHGKTLIRLLSHAAQEQIACSEVSLYVMQDNDAATRCYESVGFRDAPAPKGDAHYPDVRFMIWELPGH